MAYKTKSGGELTISSPSRHHSEIPRKSAVVIETPPSRGGEKVTLLVDGKRFTVNPAIFVKHPNTMLGR